MLISAWPDLQQNPLLPVTEVCLSAETQEGPAPVTDNAAGEEADPRMGGTAGTASSDAEGSNSGITTPGSLTICCATMTMIYTTTTTIASTINSLRSPTIDHLLTTS